MPQLRLTGTSRADRHCGRAAAAFSSAAVASWETFWSVEGFGAGAAAGAAAAGDSCFDALAATAPTATAATAARSAIVRPDSLGRAMTTFCTRIVTGSYVSA